MEKALAAGLEFEKVWDTDKSMAVTHFIIPGAPDIMNTPSMIMCMELTCHELVVPYLKEGEQTVGTFVNITHTAATPVGMKVTVKSKLENVEGRKLTFHVEAFDEVDKIGEGSHGRFIIGVEKFGNKLIEKGRQK